MFEIYNKGDKIIYGLTGVCVIDDICEKELIRNKKNLYYVLKPVFQQNNIIYAPVENAKVFMRPLLSKEQVNDLILKIPEIKEKSKSLEYSPQDCQAELSSHKCVDLVQLTARIYEKKRLATQNKKKLGFSDEKYMRIAENLLFGEISAVLDIPYEDVKGYIEEQIKTLVEKRP